MTADRLLTLLFAACCLFAVVNMAVSLETTIDGTPDDVVDVDTQSLPLPADTVDQLSEAAGSAPGSRPATTDAPDPDSDDRSSERDGDRERTNRERPQPLGGEGDQPRQRDSDDGDPSDSSDSQPAAAQPTSAQPDRASSGGEDSQQTASRGWLGRLLGLLGMLLAAVLTALAYRKRELLRRRLRALLGPDERAEDGDSGPSAPHRPPENEIERQWLETVSRADADPTATPRERASAAVQAGLPRTPVRELTALYERVRYGDQPVTDRTVAQAASYARQSRGERDE